VSGCFARAVRYPLDPSAIAHFLRVGYPGSISTLFAGSGIRASFEQSSTATRWYRAASEPRLGRALQAMHDEPERAWTVPELAHLSAMSRPSFARNFERALGQSPMQYLTDWRLTLARDYLLAGELTLEQIADRTGYSSPNAFAATFRRHVGLAPGRWRQQHSSKPSIPA